MASSKLVAAAALLAVALTAVDAGPFGMGLTGRYQMAKRAQRKGDPRRGHNLLLDEQPGERVGGAGSVGEFPPELFGQFVDHFPANGASPDSTGVWSQRWWYNATHWSGAASGAPVFVFIEGEGPSTGRWVTQGHMMEMAQRYNALAVSLEHRFYGLSYPTADMSTKNLTLLSSQQALADLATFSAHISKLWNLTAMNPFISFGGSYAGALSSWYRLKHPDAVFAAVASSPPVEAVLDFDMYDNVIHASFANPLVGGSVECTQWIDAAYANLTAMLTTPSRYAEAVATFHACENITTLKDTVVFAAGMADNVKGIAQYNMNKLYGLNIDNTCAIMLNNTSPKGVVGQTAIQRLQTLFEIINAGECMDISYANMVAYLSAPQKDIDQASRQWTYQTCNEFGYFQDCAEDASCMFSDLETVQYYTDLCNTVFGINAQTTTSLIAATNTFYGSRTPGSSRVIFVNGLIDPWHALSILSPISDDLPAITIADGSHCSDMSASKATDPDDLRNARIVIDAQVGAWVVAAHNPDSGSSGLSTKEKVIIGVCVSVAAVLLIVLAVVCCRKKGGSSTEQPTGEFTRM